MLKLNTLRLLGKSKKKLKDRQTVWKYKQALEKEKKIYSQTASGTSDTDRKSRALTVGECCLKTLEAVGTLNLQHKLMPGTLEYMINQVKVKDDTGRKGFDYFVTYQVMADEPAFTKEQIREKLTDLVGRLKLETEELFADEEEGSEEDGYDDTAGQDAADIQYSEGRSEQAEKQAGDV